jgi:hypothetical protein
LEQRTLQFGDTKHLLEMGIQNIEELQRKSKDRPSSAPAIDEGQRQSKSKPEQLTPYANPPVREKSQSIQMNDMPLLLTREEQSRDERKSKEPPCE